MPHEIADIGAGVGGGVEDLIGGDTGIGVGSDIADRVPAALTARQPGLTKLTDQQCSIGKGNVVELNVLAGGDVAFLERDSALDHIGKGLHLLRRDTAERELDANHLHV
jgi:hypothetical protein